MCRSHAPHAFLEWAAIVDGEVSLAQFVVVYTVEALDWAVAHDPAVFLLVGTFIGMFFSGVVREATDVVADVLSRALTLLHCVGEDVIAGILLEGDEFACKAYS